MNNEYKNSLKKQERYVLQFVSIKCTGGTPKQISQGELNTVVRSTLSDLLYKHKHTSHPPLSELLLLKGDLIGIVYFEINWESTYFARKKTQI